MSTIPAPEDGTRLGRAVAARMRRPGPRLGRTRPSPIGSVASSSVRMASGWGRPVAVRRALAGPSAPMAVRSTTGADVAPPRWWAQTVPLRAASLAAEQVAEIPRGLPLMVQRIPDEVTRRPGAVPSRLKPETIRVRVSADVRAAGTMVTDSDGARARSAHVSASPPGSPPTVARSRPGNDEGSGRSSSTAPPAGVTRTPGTPGTTSTPLTSPVAAAPSPGGRLLRRRALATAVARARTERAALTAPPSSARATSPAGRTSLPGAVAPLSTPGTRADVRRATAAGALPTSTAPSAELRPAATPTLAAPTAGAAAAQAGARTAAGSTGPAHATDPGPSAAGRPPAVSASPSVASRGDALTPVATPPYSPAVPRPSTPSLSDAAAASAPAAARQVAPGPGSVGATPAASTAPAAGSPDPALITPAALASATSTANTPSTTATADGPGPATARPAGPAMTGLAMTGLARGGVTGATPGLPVVARRSLAGALRRVLAPALRGTTGSTGDATARARRSVAPGTAPAAAAIRLGTTERADVAGLGAPAGRRSAGRHAAPSVTASTTTSLAASAPGPAPAVAAAAGAGATSTPPTAAVRPTTGAVVRDASPTTSGTTSSTTPAVAPGLAASSAGATATPSRTAPASGPTPSAADAARTGARPTWPASPAPVRRLSSLSAAAAHATPHDRPSAQLPGAGHHRVGHRPGWADDARRGLGIERGTVRRATRSSGARSSSAIAVGAQPGLPGPNAQSAARLAAARSDGPVEAAPGLSSSASATAVRSSGTRTSTSTPAAAGAPRSSSPGALAALGAPAQNSPVRRSATSGSNAASSSTAFSSGAGAVPAGHAAWESSTADAPGPGFALRMMAPQSVRPASGATGGRGMTARPALAGLMAGSPTAAGGSRASSAAATTGPPIRRWTKGSPAPVARGGSLTDAGSHRGIVGVAAPALAAGSGSSPATPAVAASVPALPSQWSMLPPRTAGLARPSDAPTIGGSREAPSPPPVPASALGAPAGSMMAALLASTDPALAPPSPATSGDPVSYTAAASNRPVAEVDTVEQRLLDRLEQWKREELDDHVLRLVERRLQEETERRSWRRGTEVF